MTKQVTFEMSTGGEDFFVEETINNLSDDDGAVEDVIENFYADHAGEIPVIRVTIRDTTSKAEYLVRDFNDTLADSVEVLEKLNTVYSEKNEASRRFSAAIQQRLLQIRVLNEKMAMALETRPFGIIDNLDNLLDVNQPLSE